MEERPVLMVGEDHTLLAEDLISLNDEVTHGRDYPSEIMFTVSPAVSALSGDVFTLKSKVNHPQEEFFEEEELPMIGVTRSRS